MCDFSLESVKSRAATDNEDIIVRKFITGSKGFVDPVDIDCAVCVKSGAEIVVNLVGEFSTTPLDGYENETEVFVGETAFIFHTHSKTSRWMSYRDGLITPRGRFLSLQYLPEGTRALIVKALPIELTEAVKGETAFEPEIRVETIEAQRQSLRRAFRLPVD